MVLRAASTLLSTTALFAAVLLLNSSTALASCGDWLDLHSQMNNEAPRSASVSGAVHSFRHADEWQSDSADRPTPGPCHGPHCRRAPQPLAPSAPLDWQPPNEKTLFVEAFGELTSDDATADATRGLRVHPLRGHAPRLDHPPRIS